MDGTPAAVILAWPGPRSGAGWVEWGDGVEQEALRLRPDWRRRPAASTAVSLGYLAGRARWPVSGRPVPRWVRGLPHFDEMTVGIADVATDLKLVPFRLR